MKHYLLLPIIVLLSAVSCREMEQDADIMPRNAREASRLVSVRVDFSGSEDTKSVVTESVEDFTEAYLFAFWATGADAGAPCMTSEGPVAMYTDSKAINWELPAGEPIEILAFVNAVEDVRRTLDGWASGLFPFTKDDLLSFSYSCASASDLQDLQDREYNMPMTGMVPVTIDPDSPSLTIPVKRLFAKFSISLDVGTWAEEGWTVTAAKVTGARSNTEVPYFYTGDGVGFRQADPSKFSSVDTSTAADLTDLNFRDADNRSRPVTFYFLENCQNVSGVASKWSSVFTDLAADVDNCSYLKIIVTADKAGYGQRSFGYRIYLDSTPGSGMNTTFNIVRNTSRSIVLKLGAPQDGFLWTNSSSITLAPGESVTIPFETSLKKDEITITGGLELVSEIVWNPVNAECKTGFPFSGSASLRARTEAVDGVVTVTGGSSNREIKDEAKVGIATPIVFTPEVPDRRIQFERFNVTVSLTAADHLKMLKQILPETDWDNLYASNRNIIYTVGNLNLLKNNLGIRTAEGSDAPFFEGVKLIEVSGQPTPRATPNRLILSFKLLNTELASRVQKIDIYNKVMGNAYAENLDVSSAASLKVAPIGSSSAPYTDNGYTGESDAGYGSAIYDIDIRGYHGNAYFAPSALLGGTSVTPTIVASDLEGYSLAMVTGHSWHITELNGDFLDLNYDGEDVETVLDGVNAGYFKWTYALCTYDSLSIGYWMYYSKMYDVKLQRGHITQFLSSDGFMLRLSNPRNDWWNITSEEDYDRINCNYSVTVDGIVGSPYSSINFGDHYVQYPYREGVGWPQILPVSTVQTSVGGYPPSSLVANGPNIYDIVGMNVANDLRNYGTIKIGVVLENINSGETIEAIWANVDVIREFTIYAGYQYQQSDYLVNVVTPYNNGNLSRFIPYLYAPYLDQLLGTGTLAKIVSTNAENAQGINVVNPSENYYLATNSAEHWYGHGNSGSASALWDCESGNNNRRCLLQNKVIVYDSPRRVSSNGEYSWYELQYAGPIVSSQVNFGLGHDGHHSDFVYSMRSVAVWNEPKFVFNGGVTVGAETTATVSDYLTVGKHTRVKFEWKKNVASLVRINQYDTRYIVYRTKTYTSDVEYFGTPMSGSSSMRTAYYDPRLSTKEYLKLYDPTRAYYRVNWDDYDDNYMTVNVNQIHDALDGNFSGSYRDENVLNCHRMNRAYGLSDSFWLPGNTLE